MRNILLIYTGGTIGMEKDPSTNLLKTVNFDKLSSSIQEIKHDETSIHHLSLKKVIDSSNMNQNYWIEIVEIIESNYSKMDGFVILHGSDTMAYSASILSFMLRGLSKPVIFTGSQIPIGARRTDAKENLITSIEIATNQNIKEVCIYFEDKLLRGNRTVKVNSQQFEAFHSPNYPALAKVGVNIKYNARYLRQVNSKEFTAHKKLSDNVAILKLFPGMSKNTIFHVINSADNIVMESFGSGNVTNEEWFLTELQSAIQKGKLIVNCSQCISGIVKQGKYEASSELEKIGVLSAFDMTTEAALTKLMYLAGNVSSIEKRKVLFLKNLRGEISN